MKKYTYTFTVFTPTYNRANLIHRVFESLLKQTYKDFEWIIVDDGSSDNTKEVVEEFIQKSTFPIKYIYQENGGKHRAINRGVKEAKGELFLIFDSDDMCENDALDTFKYYWDLIDDKKNYAGLISLDRYNNGKIVGDMFPQEMFESTYLDIFYKQNIKGDKWFCIKTNLLIKYPFIEFKNENFIAESSMHDKLIMNKFLLINEALLIANYQENGLSARSWYLRKNNPYGTIYTYSQKFLIKEIPMKYKIKAIISCIRFSFYQKKTFLVCLKTLMKIWKRDKTNEEN